ncbi:MAG: ribosome biogenesis GTP-binding protein YihA/YsxC [Vicinamibacterales bacterium]
MKVSAEFVTSAAGAGGFPGERLPEVALIGRSNVGKSSLLNALARRAVARTSAAPGKTRLANFYRIVRGSSPPMFLVDLPGFGYARGGVVSARSFDQLGRDYFERAAPPDNRLIAALLLVDARHPGLDSDADAWAWLGLQPCPRAVVGTKVDKLTRAERQRHARELNSLFQRPVPMVSAHTGEGLEELWKLIVRLPNRTADPEPPPPPPPRPRQP